jgi:hypothetical protein
MTSLAIPSKSVDIRYFLAAACALACLCLTPTRAALVPLTYQPNPVDLGDLDHHLVYSWRIDNINLTNISVTGASLTFKNISNWDSNPNMLFVWLLDTATHSGVASTQDVDPSQVPVVDIADAFLNPLTSLVANGTAKQKLFQQSFTTTGADFTYNFLPSDLTALQSYINNGHDIAFGLDSDCHFFNNGITFTMNVVPVPEPAGLFPVGCLVAGAIGLEIRRRRRSIT